jgi:predicted secreted Zn-dependent protease
MARNEGQMKIVKVTLIVAAGFLAGCTTTSINERTSVKVGFYDVRGTSFDEVDKQIALHGPNVEGVGNAVAATAIQMIPDVRFASVDGQCTIGSASVKVRANVTLPRLRDRSKAKREIRGAFTNIENYARLHEAVHVSIADQHAEMAEKAILDLKPQQDCDVLAKSAVRTFKTIMATHQKTQLEFDAQEKQRFAELEKQGNS